MLEKETAIHSSILAKKISQIEEPDGLQSVELQRVRHDLELSRSSDQQQTGHAK